ncbi:MAG: type IX secretion system outer membrane channel protein PorV [Capnocytophaga sp.]|nr:type IX secretion system outer membrane channel protein PorV [Capnocytophaga sp.]
MKKEDFFCKKYFLILVFCTSVFSQESRPISTAFPFLLISPDAVSSGKGDIGVASLPDAFSQYWNASKYVFCEEKSGVGVGYTPYLNKFTRDIFIGNLCYYTKTNRGAWAGSFRYFSVGDVTLTQGFGSQVYVLGNFRPSEFTFDLSYSLKLSEHYAMGVATRFLSSNLRLPFEESHRAKGFSFDISGYYLSKTHLVGIFSGKYSWGFQIANVGDKIRYNELSQSFFIPTNLKIGGGYFLETDSYNLFSFFTEANKLLVPAPNGNDNSANQPKTNFLTGIFHSFSDASDGFSEELQEISWAFGFEYAYNDTLFLRSGYFNQHKNKGDRKYLTFGTGFKVDTFLFDFSYLFSVAQTHNPLSSSLRVSLQYKF